MNNGKKIKISYNADEEMMQIEVGRKNIFFGNYWDFSRDPESLAEFFKKLGHEVETKEDLPAIG